MKSKISNQFLGNFLIIFLLTILATALAFVLMSAAGSLIAGSLAKNRYTAESIIKEDYRQIDASEVVANGGGVQAVDKEYRVVLSEGLDTIGKDSLTAQEFTDFLAESKTKTYHYDILYQPEGEFWLIVTFPTSIPEQIADSICSASFQNGVIVCELKLPSTPACLNHIIMYGRRQASLFVRRAHKQGGGDS